MRRGKMFMRPGPEPTPTSPHPTNNMSWTIQFNTGNILRTSSLTSHFKLVHENVYTLLSDFYYIDQHLTDMEKVL